MQPVRPLRPVRRRSRSRHSAQRELTIEVMVKLGVNLLLITAASSALFRLVPYHRTQQERLQQIQAELDKTEDRLDTVNADFGRHFDPQQVGKIMQEQTNRFSPNQRQIVWVDRYGSSTSTNP